MKFGKQLQLGTYAPWKAYYISYERLKRLIDRKDFVEKGKSPKGSPKLKNIEMSEISEKTPLNETNQFHVFHTSGEIIEDVENDFMFVAREELIKVNKFFVGKLADLQFRLSSILDRRRDSYRTHHTASMPSDLNKIREMYLELKNLQTFCSLNQTAFYKILKKYDKVIGTNELDPFMIEVAKNEFVQNAGEVSKLLENVTQLISRNKLIEWDHIHEQIQAGCEDAIFPSVKWTGLGISIAIYILVQYIFPPISPDQIANQCFSMMALVISLWVTHAIPYFVTGLLIPLLVTTLRVIKDPTSPSGVLDPQDTAVFCMNNFFSHTSMLILGGYTISCAFSRCQLELQVASMLQRKFGSQPQAFLLAVMYFSLFLCMWISNHTAPILVTSVLLPIIRDLPSDSRFTKAMLLGLAFSCNFGGMTTPISSVQNTIAVSNLFQVGIEVSFLQWMMVSVPFTIVGTFISWVLICLVIQPDDVKYIPVVVFDRERDDFSKRNITVIVLSMLVVVMFSVFPWIQPLLGDIAMVSMCYIIFMFGSGMLSEVDFNSLSWHTLFLLGGGNILGKAIQSSNLLDHLSDLVLKGLPMDNIWLSSFFIVCFSAVVGTFVSHTVAALILMPIITKIGVQLNNPLLVVVSTALSVSGAMGLPFSSFPNVNSVLIVDDFHQCYLTVTDFLKIGVPLTVIATCMIGTLGYVLIEESVAVINEF